MNKSKSAVMAVWLVLVSGLGGTLPSRATLFTATLQDNTDCVMSITKDQAGVTPWGGTLAFGTVDGDKLVGTTWQIAKGTVVGATAAENFFVQLKNCNAWDTVGGQTPAVRVAGTTLAGNTKLFRTSGSGSTSTGFGVALYDTQPPVLLDGTKPLTNGRYLNLGASGDAVSGNTFKAMSAGVSCGAACTAADLSTGTLSASVTFTFEYH